MLGLLNINKPVGVTSRDVVNRVQRLIRPIKVGHAGTLDPNANGVLILCLGSATRLISYVQQQPKTYRATFRFGWKSDSIDLETEPEQVPCSVFSTERIEAALPQFRGKISQVPPAHSAVHIDGKRAYQLARQGEEVEIPAREVNIYRFELLNLEGETADFLIECSSGTYIRSLCRDLGEALGTAAVMPTLERTAIGDFTIQKSLAADDISIETISEKLMPPVTAVPHLSQVIVSSAQMNEICHGRSLPETISPTDIKEIAAIDDQGNLIAILEHRPDKQVWKPKLVFAQTKS
ncbi:tRNA pseudouridine(55) synthase TruB [Calycomorphotria hydatis]|uniref:tRNA pseudouridine synthase B n=1 Tax=Calycomorphotria hydatis TaxID=2528027 RepID=A0A517T687_9PLAN|nr:tRNA pseudouridine(55) synthase TruB [Calycomorphotria hydatis]QDT63895.1 tRNA pseudouridine synthase B [Calycomorphotria hydatis]